MRRELGLQAYKRPLPEMTPEIISEFGGLSDAEIARRLSVSVSYIRRARINMEKGSQMECLAASYRLMLSPALRASISAFCRPLFC